ncbi:MAG: polysaccharide lyase, partial [Planctomycetota bacterium]
MRIALLAVVLLLGLAVRDDRALLSTNFDDPEQPLAKQLAGRPQNTIEPATGKDGTPGLRTRYVGGDMGSERVTARPMLPRPVTEATLSFDVRFAGDFQFVSGGKLHGLGPANPTTGGEPTKPDGWSTRLMWRTGGVLQTYVYDQLKETKWGASINAQDFAFETGRWYAIAMHTKLNDPPEAANGFV